MEKKLLIKISSDGDVVVPWVVDSYEEIVDLMKEELGSDASGITLLYGNIYCG
jgi:hypothetical protein